MIKWLKSFFSRLFTSGIIAKIAIARILKNNPRHAARIAATAQAALSTLPSMVNVNGLEFLLKKKAGYGELLPEERLLFEEVLAAIRADLEARSVVTFDAAPLLKWLAQQGAA